MLLLIKPNCISYMPKAGFDPLKQRKDCYKSTTLPPSHHAWIIQAIFYKSQIQRKRQAGPYKKSTLPVDRSAHKSQRKEKTKQKKNFTSGPQFFKCFRAPTNEIDIHSNKPSQSLTCS